MVVNVILSSRVAVANAFGVDFGHVERKASINLAHEGGSDVDR
jgi:hypothetical protein